MTAFETFADAYRSGLETILQNGRHVEGVRDPTSIGSNFGHARRPTREISAHAFELRDPLSCLVRNQRRSPNLSYCYGQFLYVASGSNEVLPIAFYNPAGHLFSREGTLPGNPGPRIFGQDERGEARVEKVIAILRRDPTSRRAFIPLIWPSDDPEGQRDYPCAIGLHFEIRDGALDLMAFMRSQSALMVQPYDVALFAMLQVWVSARLGISVGKYRHYSSSFHIYEDEIQEVHEVLQVPTERVEISPFASPGALQNLWAWAESLRKAVESAEPQPIIEEVAALTERPGNYFEWECKAALLLDAVERVGLHDAGENIAASLPKNLRDMVTDRRTKD